MGMAWEEGCPPRVAWDTRRCVMVMIIPTGSKEGGSARYSLEYLRLASEERKESKVAEYSLRSMLNERTERWRDVFKRVEGTTSISMHLGRKDSRGAWSTSRWCGREVMIGYLGVEEGTEFLGWRTQDFAWRERERNRLVL